MMDTPLSQLEQLFQNVGMGPHLPLVPVPPVSTVFWTPPDWARWCGLSLADYLLVCRIGARHSTNPNPKE